MSYLYVDSNGQQKGPLPLNVLENLLRKGAAGITSLTLCWTNGMDTWKPLIEIPELKNVATFFHSQWHYLDPISNQTSEPISTRLLLHKLEIGELDGLTLVYNPEIKEWKQVSEIPLLKEEFKKILDEQEKRDELLLKKDNNEYEEIKEDNKNQNIKTFTSDDGKTFVWDDLEDQWILVADNNKEDENQLDNNNNNNDNKTNDDNKDKKRSYIETNNNDDENNNNDNIKKIKENHHDKKKKKENNWIYIEGLPSDITEEELINHFSKVGILALNPIDQQPKLKIYRDDQGNCKGDAKLCFFSSKSSKAACEYLNDGYIRLNNKIKVSPAKFDFSTSSSSSSSSSSSTSSSSLSQAKIKIARSAVKQSLTWNEEDEIDERIKSSIISTTGGVSNKGSAALKIVVFQGAFHPSELTEDYEEKLHSNLAKDCESLCGPLEKFTLYSKNPLGIILLKFCTTYSAKECIKNFNNKIWNGKEIKCYYWDGETNYDYYVNGEQEDEEEEKRLDEFGNWLDEEQDDLPEEFRLNTE